MLSDSKKLTDGLIIYSALISDFEKLDFKNDALAGVRANYFNSNKLPQYDKTEISLDDKLYNISYHMKDGEPLSWKVTRNNQPFQSVKKATGGVYSVIFYGENGIINKRTYFDNNHIWIRTEYYNSYFENVKIAVLSSENICGVVALKLDRISNSGKHSETFLYPSATFPQKKCTGLIYSNVGMLWYDESFIPEDMPVFDKKEVDGGFKFNNTLSDSISSSTDFLNMSDAEYLEESVCIPEAVQTTDSEKTQESADDKDKAYSAYDKIANILSEAHKTNKDLFGEIINQTSGDLFEQEDSSAAIEDNLDAEASSESETSADADIASDDVIVDEVPKITTDMQLSEDEADKEFDSKENPDCNVIIHTKSGRYTYYGNVDENNNRVGRGRTVTPDGLTSYDGEYLNDKRNGFGVCYYIEGNINYVGNWIDGSREGCGVGYRLSDGTMHAGRWTDNAPDGYGARFDADGNFIDVCSYSNGKRNGKSVSFDDNGKVIIKVWKDGELVSEYIADDEA